MKKLLCFGVIIAVLLCSFPVSAAKVSAKAAVVINGDTGEIIYSHNPDRRLPMASTTKIMTALLLCEKGDLKREITVTAEMLRVEGSSMGLLSGDKVTLHDLLYGMMLASGNDAANVTAYTLGGTVDGFVKMMNDKAAELGLKNTHFDTPSGLDGESHYTTAYELGLLARYAMQNEEFAKAAASKSATLCYGNPPYRRTLTNHNRLLKTFDGAVGVKTGFTKKSGRCLVTAARRDGKFVIAVTLNDPDDWRDHTALLEYGLNKVRLTKVEPERQSIQVAVVGGVSENIKITIPSATFSSLENEKITAQINLPKFVFAPISKGEKIGSVVYKKGDTLIKETELLSDDNINERALKLSFWDSFTEKFRYIFLGIWEK